MTNFVQAVETPPTQYIYPTDRQLILALIAAIASHPWVNSSEVYYPKIVGSGGRQELIRIVNYRDVGGTELVEPGLTLAVYPHSSLISNLKGGATSSPLNKSLAFEAYTMGGANDARYSELAKFRVIVQLYYLDASFNEPVEIEYDLLSPKLSSTRYSHSRYVRLKDSRDPLLPPAEQPEYPEFRTSATKTQKLTIRTFPGEQVLRDWMPILRAVVRDLNTLQPYAVRRPTILSVDYPTSNWLKNSEGLIFHTAYMMLEYQLWEPPGANDYLFPNPNLNITAEDAESEVQLHPVPKEPFI